MIKILLIPLVLLMLTIPNVNASHEYTPELTSATVSLDAGNTLTEEVDVQSTQIESEGFTGWKQEGNRMVAYRLGQVVDSYEIGALPTEQRPEPNVDTTAFDFTEDAGILSLRLQIMQVLESILSILFRV
jgi:hypothetical protein